MSRSSTGRVSHFCNSPTVDAGARTRLGRPDVGHAADSRQEPGAQQSRGRVISCRSAVKPHGHSGLRCPQPGSSDRTTSSPGSAVGPTWHVDVSNTTGGHAKLEVPREGYPSLGYANTEGGRSGCAPWAHPLAGGTCAGRGDRATGRIHNRAVRACGGSGLLRFQIDPHVVGRPRVHPRHVGHAQSELPRSQVTLPRVAVTTGWAGRLWRPALSPAATATRTNPPAAVMSASWSADLR